MTEAEQQVAARDTKDGASASQIQAELTQAIRDGRCLPGSQLPNERQLAERYGTSRQQVRDALLILNEAGLIARKVGSGTWVSENAPQVIERLETAADAGLAGGHSRLETIEARMIIEPGVATLAARNITQAKVADLKAALEAVPAPASWSEFKSNIHQFTRACYVASGNTFLLWTFDQIARAQRDQKPIGQSGGGMVPEIVRRHSSDQLAQIFRAIADGDEARAEAVTRAYLVAIAATSGVG